MSDRPPQAAPAAWQGPLGDLAGGLCEDNPELDPTAVLLCLLVAWGAVVGPSPHAHLGGRPQRAATFGALVGPTGTGRKSTAIHAARQAVEQVDDTLRVRSGHGSGEALLDELAEGSDRRVLVVEQELASVFQRAHRTGSTLAATLREAWDGGTIQARSRSTGTVRVTDPHVALLGAITPGEAAAVIDPGDLTNGLANRILWCWSERPVAHLSLAAPRWRAHPAVPALARALPEARRRAEVPVDDDAFADLEARHRAGPANGHRDEIGEALGARGVAHQLRLALALALADGASTIGRAHTRAAGALVDACAATARRVFARVPRTPLARRVVEIVSASPDGVAWADLRRRLSGRARTEDVQRAVLELEDLGLVVLDEAARHLRPTRAR